MPLAPPTAWVTAGRYEADGEKKHATSTEPHTVKLRRQLVLLSLCTLALPWAGCQYLRQVDQALSQGQMQILEATGNAVAARLASAPELIAPNANRSGRPPGAQLYLNPLPQAPILNGLGEEWRALELSPRVLRDEQGKPLAQVTLGKHGDQIYLLLTVKDRSASYHDPRSSGISSGDTVEIHTALRQYTLPVASQGPVRALWYDARRGDYQRELRLRGRWAASPHGYQLEFSLPYALTGGELAITVLDRKHSDGATPARRASTLPADSRPGALVEPLPALQQELEHFARPELQLTVVDQEGFVLARAGSRFIRDEYAPGATGESDTRHWLMHWFYRQILAGEPLPPLPRDQYPESLIHNRETAGRWFDARESGGDDERIGVVSVPVVTRADDIIERPLLGRVITAQSASALQSLTESAARRLWLTTAGAAGLVLLLLLGYASWLSWRIRRLHQAARNAVDASGRLRGDFPQPWVKDELGALNRAFASLLSELDHYHQYLRSLAGKLSHELRTPLAVVRSSLDNLSAGELDSDSRRYAERAADGGARLSSILNALSAATHLEASISQAEREDFDLADLLEVLTQSYADAHPSHQFRLQCPQPPLPYHGAPELLAQLLDKLIDNAVSFAPLGSEIQVVVSPKKKHLLIAVSNDGPPLPDGFGRKLFDSLVSVRNDGGKAGHLGLGLHIARLIADFHQGELRAKNRDDGKGVTFTLQLPH
ncbi:ATP-binding protein [Microbulbifer bruguierae]|uniref:histidine kinase n=1 Tax=Microbulbifer bruguierae TaxID=3029061 RepID=A0ABY8NGZ1_9GAMM|nr:ATP-binding protein [Microbulbifer bruguierae]WGL18206.1 ATP-binding protein [Microbulbifer bruguierae]